MLFDELENDADALFDDADIADDIAEGESVAAEIPPPRATMALLGHESVEQQLLSMLQNNRFPHGLIFSGMEGIGKSVMAFRLARYLFAQDAKENEDNTLSMFGEPAKVSPTSLFVGSDDPVFSRVTSGGNPDLLLIERPMDEKTGRIKSSVPVDEIRKIAPFMRKTASVPNGWRIVIVDDADTMTRSSQNSLLKILEEPPEKSLLILVAHRAGALLPTIYSRCVHIPFQPLPDDIIRAELVGRCPSDRIPTLVSMAEGSLGAAYEYTEEHHADVISQAVDLLHKEEKLNWNAIQVFADFFGNKGNDEAQRIFRETMMWVAGGLVRNRLPEFARFQNLPLAKRLKIYDDLRAHFDRCLIGNLDKRFLIIGAYMTFEQ